MPYPGESRTSFESEEEAQKDQNPAILRDDTGFAAGKIAAFQYLSVGVLVFLLISFWDLQVNNPEFYEERAERNRIRSVPMPAARGKILDRDGRIIVDNHSSFSVRLHRENLNPEHLRPIADGLNLDYNDLVQRLKRYQSRAKYEPVLIKQNLTPGEVAFVESHRGDKMFPELELIHGQQRLYPKGGLCAHVIGYVGEITESQLNSPEFAKYTQGDVIGQSGVEREYNDVLMGVDGQSQWIVDSTGSERYSVGQKEAVPGKSLQLTIDLDLQAVAELAMEGRVGAVVALDPRNGEVLAMVSRPAFDLNAFAGRIRNSVWDEIRNDPYKPMINRAIQARLAPGSTFKPIAALAGLESGMIGDGSDNVVCRGGATFYGRYFRCHAKNGHGQVDLQRGMIHSCDVYFYTLGNRLGIDRLAKYGEMSGLGRKTGIDLPHEADGLMPSSAWKIRTQRQKWFLGETISVAIGQGQLQVTPLQLAHAIGGIANQGVWHKPHLVKDAKQPAPRVAKLDAEHVERVVRGMYGVVNEGGTARSAALAGIELCGKTGTAQLVGNELLDKNKALNEVYKDTAWFVGFAPRKNPEIVVVALFQSGEHGDRAAPIVRDVVKAYFDKKARVGAQKHALLMRQQVREFFALWQPPAWGVE
jgi:penicillin-binding protein 2